MTDFPTYPLRPLFSVTHLISLFAYRSPADFSAEAERHDFWEFIYVGKGQMQITAGERCYLLKAGELAFHLPGESHSVCGYGDMPAEFTVCEFVCADEEMQYFRHRILTLNAREREYLSRALEQADQLLEAIDPVHARFRPYSSVPVGTEQLLQTSLEQLLISLYRRQNGTKINHRVSSFSQQNSYRRLTQTVKDYLEQHLRDRLTLERIAEDLCYSVPQMKKLFRAETGQGVIDYFIDCKLAEACRLIREGNRNFSEISLLLGYENVHYFSRLFKARVGMTMSEYAHGGEK